MAEGFGFELLAEDGDARAGRLRLPHAVVDTPVFMPVGTQASVKSQTPDEVEATGARLILANTYHLMLRPTAELIGELGGAHRFMSWPHGLLTDSGGYQVFSLAELRKLDDDGAVFRSHLDGSEQVLTPERAMQVQALLGSDIAMVLDECPPAGASKEELERALRRALLRRAAPAGPGALRDRAGRRRRGAAPAAPGTDRSDGLRGRGARRLLGR